MFTAHDGFELRFAVNIPKKLAKAAKKSEKSLPVVLALHYGFDRSRPFPEYYGQAFMERVVSPGLKDLDAILIAPDSHGKSWSDPTISGAVIELMKAALEAYPADPQKVVITGYSMGGAGTWHLIAEHGELWSAALPMAGRTDPVTLKRVSGVPVRALHSVDDELIAIEPTRRAVEYLEKRGENVQLVEVRGITHFQSPLFADLLEDSIPWLHEQWQQAEDPQLKNP